jgi:hypothetical protein
MQRETPRAYDLADVTAQVERGCNREGHQSDLSGIPTVGVQSTGRNCEGQGKQRAHPGCLQAHPHERQRTRPRHAAMLTRSVDSNIARPGGLTAGGLAHSATRYA